MYLRYKRGGLVNMIYYDSLFDIQKVGDYYVLYFGNLHKAIKLNYKQLFLVKTILKSDGILDEKIVAKNNIDQLAYIKQKLSLQKFNHITCVYLPNSKSEISEFIPYPHDDSVSNLMEIKICGACKSEIAIDSNGDVYPCQMLLKKEFLITNIKKDSWQDDLKRSKVYALFNQNVLKIDECKDCVYKFICGNGCKALCKNLYGKINRKNYFMCDYFKEEARSYIKGLFL